MWVEEQIKPLKEIKEYTSTVLTLAALVEKEELYLYMAVFEVVVSTVLVREKNKKQKPMYYTSKMLLDADTRYIEVEMMVLALVTAKNKLRHYFESHTIVVVTSYPIR